MNRGDERTVLVPNGREDPQTTVKPGPSASRSGGAAAKPRAAARRRFLPIALIGALLALSAVIVLRHRRPLPRPVAAGAAREDPTEARLRRNVEARPDDASARMEFGKYYEGMARPFEAMCEYAEANRLRPGDAELPQHLAAVLQASHVDALAATRLTEGLQARPDDLRVRQRLAELDLAAAEPQKARAVMEERRAAVWEDADAVLVLGRARQACGDAAGAVSAFKHSLALRPQQAEAWYRMGRVYLALGKIAAARDGFFHATAGDRSHPEYPYYAGMTYLQSPGAEKPDPAINFFKMALAQKSGYTEADYGYGMALERMGRRREAMTRYSRAILDDLNAADPNLALGRDFAATGDMANSHRYMGRYYDLKDRPVEAAREFRAMAVASPRDVKPVLLEGQIYIRTQQDARAVAVTEAALKQHPDDPQLLERLAVLKINRGDRPYARRLLHHWLEIQPKASRPLWLLGRCDLGDLKYAEGVDWLEKAVAKQPANPNYLAFLGGALLRIATPGSLERAAKVLAQAVDLETENAEYRDLYAQSLQRLGRDEEAWRQYLRTLDLDPYRISSYTPVSLLAWRLHRPGVAEFFPSVIRSVQRRLTEETALWRRVWEHPDDAGAHLNLARFLCRSADLTKARAQLEYALQLRPGWPDAQRLLSTVRRAQEAA